jgi:acetoacetyl-CoA synthetase
MTDTIAQTEAAPLWTPTDPSSSQTERFRERVNEKHNLSLETYEQLWEWSCSNRGSFWSEVWDYEQVIGIKGSGPYVDEPARPSQNPSWFPDASLNWAENQLRHHKAHPDDIALIQISESCSGWTPTQRKVNQRELYTLVGKVQRSMRDSGLEKGDRVAYWGGNTLEAVVVLLATSSLGGIFSSAAADFGTDGVIERMTQIRPKLLFVTNGVVYNAAPRPLLSSLSILLDNLEYKPEKVIVISHLPEAMIPRPVELKSKVVDWEEYLDQGEGDVEFTRMGFNEPIWILFSSGTTGKPKAIVVSTSKDSLSGKKLTTSAPSRRNADRFASGKSYSRRYRTRRRLLLLYYPVCHA